MNLLWRWQAFRGEWIVTMFWVFCNCFFHWTSRNSKFLDFSGQWSSKAYSKPYQTMESFSKIVNGFQPSTIFAKSSIADVGQSSEQASDLWANDYKWCHKSVDKWCHKSVDKFPSLHGFAKILSKKYPSFSAMIFAIYIHQIFPIVCQKTPCKLNQALLKNWAIYK